ncbi:hypothetical protein SUGI_0365910 [Cryptomeria japonica]|uniref:disease resistance RPP13-like protein 4 n=1 Tax=Cryptomeria japonica TaxID=3369 RepID=UPI002408D611|nr:disease resistance RPP13-like protein 4 [Cryptomeria japonica]GLJ20159.1 hypothetical protein SUGI_0365910 [Cryptomeria japonica]
MASAVVDVVVEKFGGMIIEQINKEVSLVLNFKKDFEWLKKKLTNVRGYLTDADAQSANNESVKRWLLDIADIAWDAEDILDECAVQSKGANNEIPQSSCVCAFSYSQLAFRYKMARRIKDVKDRMRTVMADAAELKLVRDVTHPEQPSTSTSQTHVNFRGSSVIERGSRPVAIESKVEDVLRLLDDPAAPVIAVVGMGGVGKTFLMQNVYKRIKVKFQESIWLSISQTYTLKKLQADMASEINLNEVINGQLSEVQAAKLIYERLQSTSSLVVLDDVWRATGEDDLISALGLPTGNDSRCKIVVTTRSRHVSNNMNARVYDVHPLSQQESWELFCAFAFPDSQKNQPPQQLAGIAREVEGECGRLPLAVKTVAASLAGKRLSRDWETKLGQLRAVLDTEDPIMQILKLSYDSLPVHLKPCFAYLSFFPEDEEIKSCYLINLWIAEGYIPQKEDQHQLDIGWNYLCHLYSLCLVESVGAMYMQGSGSFKLHDLLLDLAISIGKESQCAFSVDESFRKGPAVQASCSYRRILMGKKSIVDGDVDVMASNRAYSASRLRTLSFSQNRGIQKIPAILLSGARVLRVLDLSGTGISSLPACVGNLKLLRVLNLSGTNIAEVPECVKSNTSLRFLYISICENLEQLPEWIGELNFLEHLDLLGTALKKVDGSMPKGLSKLVSLQVLMIDNDNKLSVEDNEFLRLEHFVNLVNLHEVWIGIHHEAELKSIEDGILSTLVKMRTLGIINSTNVTEVNLPPLSEKMLAMKDLEFLHLEKFAVPNWICGFSNLMQLELWDCHCAEYPALEMMPNLIKLDIWRNDICKALPKGFGKSKGFPQLLFLNIQGCSVLEEFLELEEGAMPHLEILRVFRCPNLKKVPSGLEHLRSLKECHFGRTGVDDMLKEGEELWNKLKVNNSNVIIKTDWW